MADLALLVTVVSIWKACGIREHWNFAKCHCDVRTNVIMLGTVILGQGGHVGFHDKRTA